MALWNSFPIHAGAGSSSIDVVICEPKFAMMRSKGNWKPTQELQQEGFNCVPRTTRL
eukprot:CAMPEP_0179203690 /NCGR_PEP_ID=MMETSP0796-20121207/101536_1 /TAXON_ID=73915 /ORGANISM="Pyrodinium bahamense, Strain pbaha01" /LENGTH=56 /DNA_ID=CAMNT_0020908561 /DNA_START=66 /DNA_END=236 /DNA_ORIENTATION=+